MACPLQQTETDVMLQTENRLPETRPAAAIGSHSRKSKLASCLGLPQRASQCCACYKIPR